MHSQVRWIPRGNFQPLRYRPGGIGNWSGHLPFAGDLVAAIRPTLFVELGTHYGESYFGFCQAVAETGVGSTCYAVDSWVGEEQAGSYDESVYQEVHAYNESLYKSFSYLLRKTFDEAVDSFADESIDLLHIDGLHTYDAVSHDFHNWLPKVKPGGVVLLHDVMARHGDFGVWKLWDEMSTLGERFVFTHNWGLGVFRKATRGTAATDCLSGIFDADAFEQEHLRKFYSLCALKLEHDFYQLGNAMRKGPQAIGVQLFPKIADQYSPEVRYDASFEVGQWRKIRMELSAGIGTGPLRIDLAQQPCILDVAGITLREAVLDEPVWAVVGPELASLQLGGDMSLLETAPDKEFCRYLSTGNDPQMYLSPLGESNLDQPLYLDIWIRAIVDPASLLQTIKLQSVNHQSEPANLEKSASLVESLPQPASVEPIPEIDPAAKALSACNAAIEELQANHDQLLKQHDALQQEKNLLAQSYRKLQTDLYVSKTDFQVAKADLQAVKSDASSAKIESDNTAAALQTTKAELKSARDDIDATNVHLRNIQVEWQQKIERGTAELAELTHARNVQAGKCRELEETIKAILSSKSWRLTAPLRNFKRNLR